MGTIDTSDCSFAATKNYDFLRNLPVYNPKNFSKCNKDRELILKVFFLLKLNLFYFVLLRSL